MDERFSLLALKRKLSVRLTYEEWVILLVNVLLGTLTNLRKAAISLVMPVCTVRLSE